MNKKNNDKYYIMNIDLCELHTIIFLAIIMFGISIIYIVRKNPRVIFVNEET